MHQAWTNNSYDGLLCFSQGAALGGLLCLLQQTGKLPFRFNFCILVSGFVSDKHKDKFAALGEDRIQIPSLHITGEKDSIIDGSRSEELSREFLDGQVCRHPGGHYLPYTGDTKDAVLGFLEARLKDLVAKEEAEGEKGAWKVKNCVPTKYKHSSIWFSENYLCCIALHVWQRKPKKKGFIWKNYQVINEDDSYLSHNSKVQKVYLYNLLL